MLTEQQRQLIINMADLWIREKGAAGAQEGLFIIHLMKQEGVWDQAENEDNSPPAVSPVVAKDEAAKTPPLNGAKKGRKRQPA